MSDRTTREERERLAALTGEGDLEAVDPREERSVQPATYAADGVCSGPCGTDAGDAPEAFVEAALEAVEEWVARNEPLHRQAFDDLRARFAREPGVPAVPRGDLDTGAVHLREVSAEELGAWVADTDVALLDLDETVRFADLHGVPVDDDAIVPLVVAAEGLFGEVAEDFHAHFHALRTVRDRLGGEGRVLTDGGPDDPTPLDAQQWATALDEASPQSFGEVVRVLEESNMVDGDARELVEAALEAGTLGETEDFRIVLADGVEDGDSTGVNPTPDGVENTMRDGDIGPEVFRDAIDYFHAQLDREVDIPGTDATTPREYLRQERGWADDTIDRARLGWAPAGDHALLDHLMQKGYGREEILATGLFFENGLRPHFAARIVFPYFNTDERPVYAIARTVEHPEDSHDPGQKYVKAIKTKDYSAVDEPIYGLASVEEGEPVLVTEGVADAITAHEAGYPCVSPVTKTFKKKDRERLVDELQERGVGRVYIVQDAEAPKGSVDENGRLTLPQFGEGIGGAVSTAAFLDDAGLDAFIGELPRPGLEKVDLDDYLHDWGSLDPVLASAKPANQHPAFEPGSAGSSREDGTHPRPPKEGDTDSALFDLDLVDVANVEAGKRYDNPLGHHGDSGGYYWVADDGETAFEFKYKVTYTPLTHLLVDAGERTPDDPEGPLSDAEVFAAWRHAKATGALGGDDPVPYRGLLGVAVDDGVVDRDDLVERDTETGRVVESPDDYDGETYRALPGGTYNDVLEHVREEYDVDPGRSPATSRGDDGDDTDPDEYRRDPTEVDVVLEPRRAWDAARRVTPDDLDDQPLDPEGDGWADPATGGVVRDVARAVAIAEYPDVGVDTPLGDRYAEAYRLARDRYGAPLPEYLSQADAVERYDYVLGAVRELNYWHLDEDALSVDVTGRDGDVSGEAVRTLDPTPADGWRDSESGESVLVFPSGTVYDVDLGEGGGVVDALRFVALDAGLLEDATDPLEGDDFSEAYRLARDRYGAPLPRWNAGAPDVTPVLPPAEELVDTPASVERQEESLATLREDVETLYRDTIREADGVDVLNVLPALGKTTSAIKTAAERPTTYVAARKELMKQAEEKALEHGASYQHLPVFAEANLVGEAVERGVEAVRERGKALLRNRWELLDDAGVGDDGDMYAEEDEDADTVDLKRATCSTAEGEHGDAWAFAVHVARSLDYSPRDIHERAEALFGAPLPCQGDEEDGETCDYSDGWDAVSDPEDPVDLLIGHYTHAYVESARTHYSRSPNGKVQKSPRVVVLDEFPGRSFTETFDDDALEHAVWLAGALTDDVDDRQDLLERDVWDDDLVREWLEGEAAEEGGPTHDLATTLRAREAALSAAETAGEILDGYQDLLEEYDLAEALRRVRDGAAGLSAEERTAIAGQVRTAADTVEAQTGAFRVLRWADREVAAPLASSTDTDLEADTSALPDGELLEFVETALESDDPGMIRAAATGLGGGDDGARELSVFAEDGYAHRKAHYLLEAAVRPPQDGDNPKIATENFTFGTEDGTTLKHVQVNDNVTVVLDRNGRGAEVLQPPGRTAAGGEDVPVVGLDATARRRLWEVALGADVRLRDVHDSMRDRARTLRDVHDLQIVQTSDLAKAYEGDPSGKNLDADVALLEAIGEEYAGVHGPRERDEAPDVVGNSAVITTKVVREVLEEDARLTDVVDAWDNYGNLKGSNDLADHRLAALLGSQHYGDAEVERFAALAGEEVDRSGYGMALDYGSDVANTYLKHMREDQVMQAALRFARGESGAVVFVHTAAIREDLPVVGRGEVVKSWTETATTIAEEWQRHPGEEFTVADVAGAVDVSRRQVRRVLEEFVDAGYLERNDPGAGRANAFAPGERPGAGEVEIDADVATPGASPGQDALEVYYTGNVRVAGADSLLAPVKRGGTTPLPAPDQADTAIATAGPPE